MEINKPVSAIIVLIIALMVFFLFALPKYQESNELETELAQKEARYEGLVNYNLTLSNLLKSIEEKQDVLAKIDSALPPDPSLAPIVYFVQQKADQSQLAVKSITFSQVAPQVYGQVLSQDSNNKEVKSIIFSVDIFGSYQGLKKFLLSLERSSRLFEVNSIAFGSEALNGTAKSKNALQAYDFKLEIKTQAY